MTDRTYYLASMRMRFGLPIVYLLVLAVSGNLSFAQEQSPGDDAAAEQSQQPAMVAVAPAVTQQLQNRFQVVGRLREVKRSVVAAELPGRVKKFDIEVGDQVIKGQTILAPLDDVFVKLSVDSAKATLESAQAGVEEAKAMLEQEERDYKYLVELEAKSSAKPKEVDDAATRVKAAKARLEGRIANVAIAEARLDETIEQLKRMVIVAPFDGTVVKKLTEQGQWVDPGEGIVEIISRGQIDAEINVPERMINILRPGMQVNVDVDALNEVVSGKVVAINPSSQSAARTFPVKIRLDDQEGKLKAGMSVIALVPMSKMIDVITVPRDAVNYTASGPVVWAVLEGKALSLPVKVLFGHDGFYAVEALPNPMGPPLTAGFAVVIEGAERIMFPGQPAVVVNPQVMENPPSGS